MNEFQKLLSENGLLQHAHQEEGVLWCLSIENGNKQLPGCPDPIRSGIVADAMGLGKTIQMLGLIVANFKRRTLIVLPRALLEQWTQTIEELLGHSAHVHHGHLALSRRQELQSSPLVITTYGTLAAEMVAPATEKQFTPSGLEGLLGIHWDRVIFDEAHHLRTRTTRTHRSADAIRADHKWLLTGTPLQNSLSDIRALCHLLGLPDIYVREEGNLAEVLRNFMLQRTVADVGLVLPQLVRRTITVAWETEQERQVAEDNPCPTSV